MVRKVANEKERLHGSPKVEGKKTQQVSEAQVLNPVDCVDNS